jgi:hypothetical protein
VITAAAIFLSTIAVPDRVPLISSVFSVLVLPPRDFLTASRIIAP